MEKSVHKTVSEVVTALVMPKTLETQTELMPFAGSKVPMYAVYGYTDDVDPKRVWCATFLDADEAMAWVHGSRVFGRAVVGAVLAKQEAVIDGTRTDGGDEAPTAH